MIRKQTQGHNCYKSDLVMIPFLGTHVDFLLIQVRSKKEAAGCV